MRIFGFSRVFLKTAMTVSMFKNVHDVLKRLQKNKHFSFGFPLAVFIAGCFYYLNHSQSIRFEFRPQTRVDKKDFEALGISFPDKSKTKSLEEFYDEIKGKDISQWENKRIPRPWEE